MSGSRVSSKDLGNGLQLRRKKSIETRDHNLMESLYICKIEFYAIAITLNHWLFVGIDENLRKFSVLLCRRHWLVFLLLFQWELCNWWKILLEQVFDDGNTRNVIVQWVRWCRATKNDFFSLCITLQRRGKSNDGLSANTTHEIAGKGKSR